MENSWTKAWKLYEEGRTYNNSLTPNQYDLVKTNTEFYAGNQWINLPDTPAMRELLKPTFNILKRVSQLFIASLTSSGVTINFDALAHYGAGFMADTGEDASVFANAEVLNLLEKLKFEYHVRRALIDGAQTGDYCAHFWFDPDAVPYGGMLGGEGRGEIRMELVDGINVIFGNPHNRNVESQPYILLVGRDTVENLKAEAKRVRHNRQVYADAEAIQPDMETRDFIGVGAQTEMEADDDSGQALYVLLYTKAEKEVTEQGPDGVPRKRKVVSVRVTKATKTAVIYEDVDTGLSFYPIAWGNWEEQKNQYHGRALVTGLIPNQIFINRMFASAIRCVQLMAFPKVVYNKQLIPLWSNSIGEAIGVDVKNMPPNLNVRDVASTLQASDMSGQIFALIDKVMSYTKECLGATDAQMGNVKPDNTSAIMVLQTNAEIPLENIRALLHEWVEDIGRILLDMMGTYYGTRPVLVEEEMTDPVTNPDGSVARDPQTRLMITRTVKRKIPKAFDFSVFKNLWLTIRADVGATTYFSEIATTQTLDNLRRDGMLTAIQYLERIPDKLIPQKRELLDELKSAVPEMGASPGVGSGQPAQGGPIEEALAVRGLPNGMAADYENMNSVAKRTAREMGARAVA